jgi:hypothetical protein
MTTKTASQPVYKVSDANCSDQNSYVCGDVDGSGSVNVADVSYLTDYLFRGGPAPPLDCAANVDGNNGVNVADLTYLIQYLWQGGPEPICDSNQQCVENWFCGPWGECIGGIQTRVCWDDNNCGTINDRPPLSQPCDTNENVYLTTTQLQPLNDTNVTQYSQFNYKTSVTCHGGNCGYITATLFFYDINFSTPSMVPMDSGEPFYTIDANPVGLLTELQDGNVWITLWRVKATGNSGTYPFFVEYESQDANINSVTTPLINITIDSNVT